MPTIVDELVVLLGLDPKNFEAGQKKAKESLDKTKKAASEGSKEVSAGAGDMLKAFGGLQGKLLGIAALFTGGLGITEFSKKMAAVTTQATYLARQVGLSAQELEAWDATGAKVGATAGEISGSIAGIYRQLKRGQLHGVSSLQPYFQSMTSKKYPTGIPLVDPKTGKDRTPTELLSDASEWGQTKSDKAMVSQLWSEMGMAPSLIALLHQGPEKLRAQLDQNKKNTLSDEDRKKFESVNAAFHQLALDSDRLARSISLHLIPTIEKVLNFLDRMTKYLTPAPAEEVQKFTDKHLPEMGGKKSIFGRIKSWWDGDGDNAAAKQRSESGAAVAPSSPGTTIAPATPATPTSGGNDVAPRSQGARASLAKGYMMDQLRREGVPEQNVEAAASMLAGQAIAESNLRPELHHDGGTGYGIYGARLGRRSKMFEWLKQNGYSMNSLEGQSRYMAREAMNDPTYRASRNALMTATPESMAHGTRVLTNNFERPAVDNSSARYAAARGVLGNKAVAANRVKNASETSALWGLIDPANPKITLGGAWPKGSPDIIPHPGLLAFQDAGNVSHNNTTSSTNVQNLNIYSPSNDPNGHAADVRAALIRNDSMNQANQGPN